VSTIKLGSASELEKFLKILAEESVMQARAVADEPSRQKSMARSIQRDKAALTEEDPEKSAAPAAPEKKAPPAAPPEEAPAAAKPPTAPTPATADTSELNPTLSSLVDAIKEMRGGRGASDSAVEAELTAYFDRLEEAERISLIVMMRSIAGIMQQNLVGAQAPEPEQYDILTTKKPAEGGAAQVAAPAAKKSAPAASSAPAGEEDTTPPIRVGEPVSEAYRAKIRDLLGRTR
jgi:hypothetical protein